MLVINRESQRRNGMKSICCYSRKFSGVTKHNSENFLESAPLKGALWKVEGRECERGEKKREGENVPEGSRKSALDSNETI